MKQLILTIKAILLIFLLQSCDRTVKEIQGMPQDDNGYNLCLILDGTDRFVEQNRVPQLSIDEIMELAHRISEKGKGTFYVTYVDNECDNNHVGIFEWLEDRPMYHGDKPGYMKMTEYEKQKKVDDDMQESYKCHLADALEEFSRECIVVRELAYSDAVAGQKRGSDVNGAINQAGRLLQASIQEGVHSYIILVSDGCDNVGKELNILPPDTELIIVNSNVTKHQYQELVSKEFVTLKQSINYIFS